MNEVIWWCLGISAVLAGLTKILPPAMQAYRNAVDARDQRIHLIREKHQS